MAVSPQHIPGYYYDSELNRYFKIPPGSSLKRSINNNNNNIQYNKCQYNTGSVHHIVTCLRNRSVELNYTQYNYRLRERLIGQIVSRGVVSCHDDIWSQCTIQDIKITNDGNYIIIYGIYLYDINQVSHGLSVCKFAKQNSTIINTDIITKAYLNCFTNAERYYRLSDISVSPNNDNYIISPLSHPEVNIQFKEHEGSIKFLDIDQSVTCYCTSQNGNYYHGLVNGKILHTNSSLITRKLTLRNNKSSINDIIFINENVLCCGCDNGCVYLYDTCSLSVCGVLQVPSIGKRKSRIVRLHPLNEGTQLITSSMNSQLHLWDVESCCIIYTFNGHVNSHSFTCSFVDMRETFLAAVGDENIIKFWSLKTGQLIIKLILDKEGPRPVISHTHHLAERGLPTLLIGQGNKLSFYSSKN